MGSAQRMNMEENDIQDTNSGDLEALRAELEKVKSKNRELLAEKQKAKAKAQEALDAADEAAQQAAERSGDIEALKAAHAKELAKLQQKLDTYDTDLRTIRVDNEITKALTEHNVRPELAEAATALFKAKAQYVDGAATVDGKPLGEFIGEYLSSDTGAHFRRAADNTGGGATGNNSTVPQAKLTKRPTTPAEFDILDAMPTAERNALLDSIGAPDLKI